MKIPARNEALLELYHRYEADPEFKVRKFVAYYAEESLFADKEHSHYKAVAYVLRLDATLDVWAWSAGGGWVRLLTAEEIPLRVNLSYPQNLEKFAKKHFNQLRSQYASET